jgi:ElaB protein
MAANEQTPEPVNSLKTERSDDAYEFPTSENVAASQGDNTSAAKSGGSHFREASRSWDANGNAPSSSDASASVKNKFADIQDAVVKQYRVASDTTDDFVHENPWKAITMAALAGLVVGLLVSR